ncbi:MAG: hypothetical protein KC656_26985, partial [Myxococcales bacterium]|nr:hypothetical protein [Myxococcales bacterium]
MREQSTRTTCRWVVAVLLAAACSQDPPSVPPPTGALDVRWTAEGAVLRHPAHDLALSPTRWGRPGALVDLALGARTEGPERVEYPAGPVTAWFRERPEGLEHGFDVHERPEGDGLLELRVGISGFPELGEQNALYWSDGERVYARYDGLRAWDAEGHELRGSIDLACDTGCEAVLRVDDADATYPIVVDPLLATDATEGAIPDGLELSDVVGSALDLDGDWLGIWSPGSDAVVMYRRDASTWTAVQSIEDTAFGRNVPSRFGRSIAIDGDRMVMGAAGTVYVAERVGGVWAPRAILEKPDDGLVDPSSVPTFGAEVALSGDTVVVPARGVAAVYVFDRDASTDTWSLVQTLAGTTDFGRLVRLDGDRL